MITFKDLESEINKSYTLLQILAKEIDETHDQMLAAGLVELIDERCVQLLEFGRSIETLKSQLPTQRKSIAKIIPG